VYGTRSETDLHVDYVSHQLVRNVFQHPSRSRGMLNLSIGFKSAKAEKAAASKQISQPHLQRASVIHMR
jgi:hypothetical protein